MQCYVPFNVAVTDNSKSFYRALFAV